MKWIQITDLGLTHEFELEGDESTTIKLHGNTKTVERKLRMIFGVNVEIELFQDED